MFANTLANAPTSVQDVDADGRSDIDAPTMSAPDAHEHRLSADESAFILLVEAMEALKATPSPFEGAAGAPTDGPEVSPIADDLFCFGLILTIAFAAESDVAQLAAYVKAHSRVADPEEVKFTKKEQGKEKGEEPVVEGVLEQPDLPKAVDDTADVSVGVSEEDPSFPPGPYPIAAPTESPTDALPSSEAVPSVKASTAASAGAGDGHTPEIRHATTTNESSAGESATAPGESISAISPPSPSPNEVFGPTVVEQEAPVLDVPAGALDQPSVAQSTAASEDTNTVPTVAIPTKEVDNGIVKILDDLHSSAGAEAAPESEVVNHTAERDQSTLACGAVIEPAQSLSDEPETRPFEHSEAEHISEFVVAPSISLEPVAARSEEPSETEVPLSTSLPEETPEEKTSDIPVKSDSLDASPDIIPTEADTTPEIVAPQLSKDSVEAEPVAEATHNETAVERGATALTETERQGVAQVVDPPQSDAVAPESADEKVSELPVVPVPELQVSVEREVEEVADGATLHTSASDEEVIQHIVIEDAALAIPSVEKPATFSAPPAAETLMVDSNVRVEPEASGTPIPNSKPEVPVEASESPVLRVNEEVFTAPPTSMTPEEDPTVDLAPREVIENAGRVQRAVSSEEPAAPATARAEAEVAPAASPKAPAISEEHVGADIIARAPVAETSNIAREVNHIPNVAAAQVDDSASTSAAETSAEGSAVVGDSSTDEPSATPHAVDTDAERAPEPSAPITSASIDKTTETADIAGPIRAGEPSRDGIEKPVTPVEEPLPALERGEPEAPAATTVEPEDVIHTAGEERKTISLVVKKLAATLEDAAMVPTEDTSAVVEDMDVEVPTEGRAPSNGASAERRVVGENIAVEPTGEAKLEPEREPQGGTSESITAAEPVPSEEVPDVQTVEDGISSTEQAAASLAGADVEGADDAKEEDDDHSATSSFIDVERATSLGPAALADEAVVAFEVPPSEPVLPAKAIPSMSEAREEDSTAGQVPRLTECVSHPNEGGADAVENVVLGVADNPYC